MKVRLLFFFFFLSVFFIFSLFSHWRFHLTILVIPPTESITFPGIRSPRNQVITFENKKRSLASRATRYRCNRYDAEMCPQQLFWCKIAAFAKWGQNIATTRYGTMAAVRWKIVLIRTEMFSARNVVIWLQHILSMWQQYFVLIRRIHPLQPWQLTAACMSWVYLNNMAINVNSLVPRSS